MHPPSGDSPELPGVQQCQRMGSCAVGTAGAALHRALPPPSSCLNHKELSLQLFHAAPAIPVEKWKTVYSLYCPGQACEWNIFSKLSNSKSGLLFSAIKKPLNYKKSPLVCKCAVFPAAEGKCGCHTLFNIIHHDLSGRKIRCIKCSALQQECAPYNPLIDKSRWNHSSVFIQKVYKI